MQVMSFGATAAVVIEVDSFCWFERQSQLWKDKVTLCTIPEMKSAVASATITAVNHEVSPHFLASNNSLKPNLSEK